MTQMTLSPIELLEADLLAVNLTDMTPQRELGYRAETLRHYLADGVHPG